MEQREQKNKKIRKLDSKDKSSKTRVTLPYIRGVSEALESGLPMPWGGNVYETPPDTQGDAGTSEGQAHSTGKLRCGVPSPIQGLPRHVHRRE